MSDTIRTNFSPDTRQLIYFKIAELTKDKKRKVTIGEAIEVLLKDAYLRKPEKQG
jgi:hypothetical protein